MAEQLAEKSNSIDLKQLRQERKEHIERARQAIKEQNQTIKKIRTGLAQESKTIPELAEGVGMDTATVLFYVSTLKKFGVVGEGKKKGDYFTYELLDAES